MKQVAVIVLPTYNEADTIGALLDRIFVVTSKISSNTINILVVDDTSPDGTAKIVKEYQKKYKKLSLLSGKKKGLGAAYIRGMDYAMSTMKADILIEMDADGQHPPELLLPMLKAINEGADFVIGSRYIKGGSIPNNWGIMRKIYSTFGNLAVRFGLMKLSIADWTSGYRAMRSTIYESVKHGLHKYPGYTFQVALLDKVQKKNYSVVEVPLQFRDRRSGASKIVPPEYIVNLFLYILTNSTFIKYGIVGAFGFLLQTLTAKLFVVLNIFPGVAVGFGAFMAIVANFFGNNLWTFSHKKHIGVKTLLKKFSHFLTVSIGAVIIQGVVVEIGVYLVGDTLLGYESWFILMIAAIIFLVIPYNFFVYNRFIWKTHEK